MCTTSVLLAVVVLTGCDEALTRPGMPGLSARTQQEAYTNGEPVTLTIRNDSDTPVYFKHCGIMMRDVEVETGGCWERLYFTVCKGIHTIEYRRLNPGETLSFVDPVVAREDGVYRWAIPFGTEARPGLTEKLFSNSFRVE